MIQKNVDSTVFEGKVSRALMFFKVGNQDVALLMKWDDEHGWHSPKPVGADDMVAIANQTSSRTEFLPDKILTYTSEINFSWWVPAKRRNISVKGSTRKVFYYPAMVFNLLCGTLRVGCLRNNRRPNPSTRVYNIFNAMDVHHMDAAFCNTRTPNGIGVGMIPEWENAFFESTYNMLPDLKNWKLTGDVSELCTE